MKIILVLFLCVWSAALAGNVYVFPFLQKQPRQQNDQLVKGFIQPCSNAINVKKILMDLTDFTQFTVCFGGKQGDCDSLALSASDVTLKENKSYKIKDNMKKLLLAEPLNDRNKSIGVILANVPCNDFPIYPDINDLFGKGLNDTVQLFNNNIKMQTHIVWLTSNVKDKSTLECDALRNYAFKKTDYLQLHEFNYKDAHGLSDFCDQLQ